MRIFNYLLLIAIIFALVGCSNIRTRDIYKENLLLNVQNRNYPGALQVIEENREKCFPDKDRVLYHLYLGILLHYNKQYDTSSWHLTEAEEAINELFTKSVTRAASAMLLNDNTFAYAGEDYEDIYINIFKALNYMAMDEDESAFVEIRRINNKLNVLEDKYKKYAKELNSSEDSKIKVEVKSIQFNNSALARFLSMLLYRADNKLDDVRIDSKYIDEAFKLQSHIYNFSQPNLSAFNDIKAGKSKISFLSFTGLSPEKYPITYRVATLDNMITVFSDDGKDAEGQQFIFPGVEAGYYFKFSVPAMRENKSEIARITVDIDGQQVGQLDKIENINRIAKETFAIKANMAYVRAVTRTVIKGIASIAASKKIEEKTNELGGFLAKIGTAVITEATEAADLRSCLVFPGFAYVGDFDINPGIHNVNVNYYNKNGVLEYFESFPNYEVKQKGINLIESYYLK